MPQQASAQQFLEIDEIKDGVLILKNKSLRAILMVSSLNFALKSEEEQTAIIYQFQNFLNSLDFSIEIIIQSRILNITEYLDKLKEIEGVQKNELLKIQTAEYRKFINGLIGGRQILSKTFFVVVPFTLIEIPKIGGEKIVIDEEQFQRARTQLQQRAEFVALGLRRCGHQCSVLNTLELIELFWALYHPEQAETGYSPEIPPEIIDKSR
jgi:KaiC/GvpD/RAD55 family RecA-like ATPase